MPLIKSCDLQAFRKNVAVEMEAGRPRAQAVAIAIRTLRDACKDAGKPVPRFDSTELDIDQETVDRYDFAPIGKATRTPQGFLRFDARLSRVGVLKYKLADGSIRCELRPPEEVFDEASIESLAGAPVTDLHSAMVTPDNVRSLQVGIVSEKLDRDGDHISGKVIIQDRGVIEAVERRDRQEGSPGYRCLLDETPGEYQGERYDAVQRMIRYNHWALGPKGFGRQGSTVALRLDGNAGASFDNPSSNDGEPEGNIVKLKIRIDGVDYELDSETGKQAVEKHIEKLDADLVISNEKASELQGRLDASEKKNEELQKKLDEANDPKRLDALVAEKAELQSKAGKILGEEFKFDGLSSREVKVAVLKKLDEKFDDKGRDDAYIDGRFDYAVASYKPEERADGLDAARRAAPTPKPGEKKPDEVDHYDADAARERMLERNRNAWKQETDSAGR